MREACGSAVLCGQGPEEEKEPGAHRAGSLEEEEHWRGADKGTPQWGEGVGGWAWCGQSLRPGGAGVPPGAKNMAAPGCQAQDTASLHLAQFKIRR